MPAADSASQPAGEIMPKLLIAVSFSGPDSSNWPFNCSLATALPPGNDSARSLTKLGGLWLKLYSWMLDPPGFVARTKYGPDSQKLVAFKHDPDYELRNKSHHFGNCMCLVDIQRMGHGIRPGF